MPKFTVLATTADTITLKTPGNNYENTFALSPRAGKTFKPEIGQVISGSIYAPAWKAEAVEMGGNYVEPLLGRPRRMQGTILSQRIESNELTVQVGYPVTVVLPREHYDVARFAVGSRIGWDNIEMPQFAPDVAAH